MDIYPFLNNKYTKIYFNIIEKFIQEKFPKDVYGENHHILPYSLGGGNEAKNIVRLTAKAHYICHHLLTKMTKGEYKHKMLKALWRMSHADQHKQPITASAFNKLREEVALYQSISFTGEGNPFYGRKHTTESRRKMSLSAKNRDPWNRGKITGQVVWNKGKTKNTDPTLRNISENRMGNKNPMFGKTGKDHPHSKLFSIYNDNNIKLQSFYTLIEFRQYCIENKIPVNGLYKSLKNNTNYLDGSKNKRFAKFNNWYLRYD